MQNLLEAEINFTGKKRKLRDRNKNPCMKIKSKTSEVDIIEDSDEDMREGHKNKGVKNGDLKYFKPLQHSPGEGEFVLVEFQGKEKKYCVAKILKEKGSNNELEVSCYCKCDKINKFLLPRVPDLKAVHVKDIKAIIMKTISSYTTRQKEFISFDYDFSQLQMA